MAEVRFAELRKRLVERGYRGKVIDSAIDRVRSMDRETMLRRVVRVDKQENRVRAVFKFDSRLPNLPALFSKNWKTMVNYDLRLLKVFPEPPMVSFTRGRNIREMTCQLPPLRMNRQEEGFKRCGRPNCRLCPFTGKASGGTLVKSVKIASTGEELFVRGHITCTTQTLCTLPVVRSRTGPAPVGHNIVVKLGRLQRKGSVDIGTQVSKLFIRGQPYLLENISN